MKKMWYGVAALVSMITLPVVIPALAVSLAYRYARYKLTGQEMISEKELFDNVKEKMNS
jgi:hypothetical protein